MIEKKEYYVELSLAQNCFHIDTMDNIQKNNLDLCSRGLCNGYVIIYGPALHSDACKYCDSHQWLKTIKLEPAE